MRCCLLFAGSVLSAKVLECQKINKAGLDQYGLEHFEI